MILAGLKNVKGTLKTDVFSQTFSNAGVLEEQENLNSLQKPDPFKLPIFPPNHTYTKKKKKSLGATVITP